MKVTNLMNTGKSEVGIFPLMMFALLSSVASAAEDAIDLSGSLGYTYRSLSDTNGEDTVSKTPH